jgi:hypothetical protein
MAAWDRPLTASFFEEKTFFCHFSGKVALKMPYFQEKSSFIAGILIF